jgi:hypothetical protein
LAASRIVDHSHQRRKRARRFMPFSPSGSALVNALLEHKKNGQQLFKISKSPMEFLSLIHKKHNHPKRHIGLHLANRHLFKGVKMQAPLTSEEINQKKEAFLGEFENLLGSSDDGPAKNQNKILHQSSNPENLTTCF